MRHNMRQITILVSVLILSVSLYGKYQYVEVPLQPQITVQYLQGLGLEVVYVDRAENSAFVAADEGDIMALNGGGVPYSIVIDDMEEYYAGRLNAAEPMGGYHTYSETVTALNQLHNEHPNIVSVPFSIGQSTEGRDLWAVRVSDNPEVDEDEPEVFYNGMIHAREPITIELLLYFMDYMTTNYQLDPEITEIVDNREIYILPIINPDGYMVNENTTPGGGGMWRKNTCDNNNSGFFEASEDGVDLNRNWGYMWGYDNIGSSQLPYQETYRGTGPFSEPETQALRDFINSHEFKVIINYHAFGSYYLHSWDYDDILAPDHSFFTQLGNMMAGYNQYDVGASWQLLYNVNGGASDWQYGDSSHTKIWGYVCEVGTDEDGFWPEEDRILPLCQENLLPNIKIALYADNPYRVLCPDYPTAEEIGIVSANFLFRWSAGIDTVNVPVSYNIGEVWGGRNFIDDMEENPYSRWILDGFNWNTNRFHSGSHSIYSGSTIWAVSASAPEYIYVDAGDTLKFWTWYNLTGNFDYGAVLVSEDNIVWETITGNITTSENPNGYNPGSGITGRSNGWEEALFPLDEYEGRNIYITFKTFINAGIQGEGWYIDDVSPMFDYDFRGTVAEGVTDTIELVSLGSSLDTLYYQVQAVDGEGDVSLWSNPSWALWGSAGIVENGKQLREFGIVSLYPNPFNGFVQIAFILKERGETDITVYNSAGCETGKVDLGILEAGNHSCNIDMRGIASGVYLIKMRSGESENVRKVVLLK